MSTINDFKRIARDVVELGELQIQLFAIDGKVAVYKLIFATVAITFAATLSLSAFTALIFAGAWALHEFCVWPMSVSLLTCGLIGLVLAMILVALGYRSVRQAANAMGETKSELVSNLRWMKSTLTSDDDSPKSQNRVDLSDRFARNNDRVF